MTKELTFLVLTLALCGGVCGKTKDTHREPRTMSVEELGLGSGQRGTKSAPPHAQNNAQMDHPKRVFTYPPSGRYTECPNDFMRRVGREFINDEINVCHHDTDIDANQLVTNEDIGKLLSQLQSAFARGDSIMVQHLAERLYAAMPSEHLLSMIGIEQGSTGTHLVVGQLTHYIMDSLLVSRTSLWDVSGLLDGSSYYPMDHQHGKSVRAPVIVPVESATGEIASGIPAIERDDVTDYVIGRAAWAGRQMLPISQLRGSVQMVQECDQAIININRFRKNLFKTSKVAFATGLICAGILDYEPVQLVGLRSRQEGDLHVRNEVWRLNIYNNQITPSAISSINEKEQEVMLGFIETLKQGFH